MHQGFLFILLSLLISGTSEGKTALKFVNSIDHDVFVQIRQIGSDTLPLDQWNPGKDTIVAWDIPRNLFSVDRDSFVQPGDSLEFEVRLATAGDTMFFGMRIYGNSLSFRATGNGFNFPWTTDDSFYETQLNIGGIPTTLKYKASDLDASTNRNMQLTLHQNTVYEIDSADFPNPNVLNVMSYNIKILLIVSEDWGERTETLPGYFSPYQDVVVFQEVFSDSIADNHLTPAMEAQGFAYNSGLLNDPSLPNITTFVGGGVIIYSKWPIEISKDYKYDNCTPGTTDCLASKGVKYAKVVKMGKPYHVFGTHMNTGSAPEKFAQFGEMRHFIDSQQIANTEPVIMAGDFNVSPQNGDGMFEALLDSVEPIVPHPTGFYTSTFNGTGRFGRIIDHVWGSRNHLVPVASDNKVVTIRGIDSVMWDIIEFSDHRTVVARLEYPGPVQGYKNKVICPEDTFELGVYDVPAVNYTWTKDGNPLTGILDNRLEFVSPTVADEGSYRVEADYQVTFGNTNDSLIQFFYPNGSDVINRSVDFDLADLTFSTTCVSGLNNRSAGKSWSIYPVITSSVVKVSGLKEDQELTIYNAMGHRVQLLSWWSTSTTLNFDGLVPGVYFVAVQDENGMSAKRVVLAR